MSPLSVKLANFGLSKVFTGDTHVQVGENTILIVLLTNYDIRPVLEPLSTLHQRLQFEIKLYATTIRWTAGL